MRLFFLIPLLVGGFIAHGQETETPSAVIATVGETQVTAAEKNDLGGRVLGLLLEQYAVEKKITVSDEETAKLLARLDEAEKAHQAKGAESPKNMLSPADQKELAKLRDSMFRELIKSWKVNKALFAQYGGRVIYQQSGPEPLDAYRKFLEARMKAGAFILSDKKYEADLWRIFRDDQLHDFAPKDQRATLINTPPWQRKKSGDGS